MSPASDSPPKKDQAAEKPENDELTIHAHSPADWLLLQPSLIDHLHDAVIISDMDGMITGCNQAVHRIFGYTQQELIGKSVGIFYVEGDRGAEQVFHALRETGKFSAEMRNKTKSGAVIYIHLIVQLLLDADKKPVGAIGLTQDITEKRLTEFALGQTDRKLRALAGVSPDFFYTARPDGWTDWISDNFSQYCGSQQGSGEGMRWLDFLHPEDVQHAQSQWRAAISSGTPFEAEYRVRRHDGQYRWFRSRCVPVDTAQREIERWVGITADIHNEKMARRELEESEQRFRTLAEAVPEAIWISTKDGIAEYANRKWLETTGLTLAQSMGNGWMQAVHPEDRPRVQKRWRQAVQSSQFYEGEYRIKTATGEYRWQLTRAVLYETSNGVYKWFGTNTDIHDSKMASEELKAYADKLAVLEERFRNLANSIPQLVWMADANGKVLWCNQRWYEFSGAPPGELEKKGWFPYIEKTSHDYVMHSIVRGVASESEWEETFRMRRSDGVYRWFLCRAIPIFDSDGRLAMWFATGTDVTEQHEIRDKLKVSSDLLHATVEHAGVGIAQVGLDGHWIMVNEKLCEITGYSREELLECGFQQITLADDLPKDVQMQRRLIAGEIPSYSLRKRYRHKSGELIWVEVTLSVVTDHENRPQYLIKIVQDISVRYQLEQRFSSALSGSQIVVFHQDANLRYTWIHNPALGYTAAEILGKTDDQIFERKEDAEAIGKLKRQVLDTGVGLRREVTVHYQGSPLWYDLNIQPLRDSGGKVCGISCAAVEVTTRHRAEQTLQYQSDLLSSVSEPVISTGMDFTIKSWNHAAEQLYGWTQAEVLDKNVDDLLQTNFLGDDRLQIINRLLQTGRMNVEAIHTDRNGRKITVASTIKLLYEDGRPIGSVGVIRDITQHKINEETERSRERIEAAARMSNSLAHEINNPLAGLTNALYLLSINDPSMPTAQLLTAAQSSADRITRITRQMIGLYSRIGVSARINVKEVIHDVLAGFDPQLRSKNVQVEKNLDSVMFQGIESDIRQLISITLENAIETSPIGSMLKLRLRLKNAGADMAMKGILLTIADNGPGISLPNRAQIFEPFFSTKEQKATGLGLWAARGITQKYNGSIRLRSSTRNGKSGTVVRIFLPMQKSKGAAAWRES